MALKLSLYVYLHMLLYIIHVGPPRSFQRMVSVPARPTPSHPHHPPALPPPSSHPRALSPPHQPQLQVDAARPKVRFCPRIRLIDFVMRLRMRTVQPKYVYLFN